MPILMSFRLEVSWGYAEMDAGTADWAMAGGPASACVLRVRIFTQMLGTPTGFRRRLWGFVFVSPPCPFFGLLGKIRIYPYCERPFLRNTLGGDDERADGRRIHFTESLVLNGGRALSACRIGRSTRCRLRSGSEMRGLRNEPSGIDAGRCGRGCGDDGDDLPVVRGVRLLPTRFSLARQFVLPVVAHGAHPPVRRGGDELRCPVLPRWVKSL